MVHFSVIITVQSLLTIEIIVFPMIDLITILN